jgi:hypothetical protein
VGVSRPIEIVVAVSPVVVKEAEASIIPGSSDAGAISIVSPVVFETCPGKLVAGEIQALSMPAKSNTTTRLAVLLLANVILLVSSVKVV